MSKRVLVFVNIVVVCYDGTVRSSFLSANTFFLYLRPSSSRFFLTWASITHEDSFESNQPATFFSRYLTLVSIVLSWGAGKKICN